LFVFRHFQHHHFIVQGELDFTCRVESVFQDLGQHLHVIDGRVPLGEHRTKPIGVEPAKEGFPLLAFLFNPVIQVRACSSSGHRDRYEYGTRRRLDNSRWALGATSPACRIPTSGSGCRIPFPAAERFHQNDWRIADGLR
jgi:hypothetical protein